ncbi:MAG: hypothetical protein PHE53_09485 [Thermoguttaceae bacterium]|nr:hypothetical protein [Thermoguttaceae bacterium]
MRNQRRQFLKKTALGLSSACVASYGFNQRPLFGQGLVNGQPSHPLFESGEYHRIDSTGRTYHLSVGCDTVNQSEELPLLWKEAGVTDLWLTTWLYGHYHATWDSFDAAIAKTRTLGMTPHLLSVPFGHPTPYEQGKGNFPDGWKPVERFDGRKGWGISCHAPADQDCAAMNRFLADRFGCCDHFLDDDFRFADSPNEIGGCVCPECRVAFLQATGIPESRWDELIIGLRQNEDTPLVRLWVDYQCDQLSAIFRRIRDATPQMDLGIMVMGMGSERAGIRLDDYRDCLFRVGEWMFNDQQYDPIKNKTIELFSVLLHRRFASPGRSFSETTICPENALSKENMASKLAFSTFADVRNTMFMCGIPASYWPFFALRMKKEARYHEMLAGKKLTGPFKHYWGKAGRYLAGYDAYSLFMALGVPFEVSDTLAEDGWTFLGDHDANTVERGEIHSPGTLCVARGNSATNRFIQVDETFESLFAFRKTIIPTLQQERIPYIEEETPVVLGWYPESHAMLLWNVEKTPKTVHIRYGTVSTPVEISALETVLLQETSDQTDGSLHAV